MVRGLDSIESDYLNGEIVKIGRLHGVPTPANAALQKIGHRMIDEGLKPGEITVDDLLGEIESAKANGGQTAAAKL